MNRFKTKCTVGIKRTLANHRATSVQDLYHTALCSVVALQRERRFIIYLNQRLAGNSFN